MLLYGSVGLIDAPGVSSAASFSATLDPTVTIDPIYLESHPGYSLVFSPNPSTPVPEPGAWSMMLIGVAGLGATARLRRRPATVAS